MNTRPAGAALSTPRRLRTVACVVIRGPRACLEYYVIVARRVGPAWAWAWNRADIPGMGKLFVIAGTVGRWKNQPGEQPAGCAAEPESVGIAHHPQATRD